MPYFQMQRASGSSGMECLHERQVPFLNSNINQPATGTAFATCPWGIHGYCKWITAGLVPLLSVA